MLRYNFQYNQKRKDELNKAIAKGFQLQTIETINDLVNIYKGVYKLGSDDISYKAKLGKVLRAYFAQIISNASIHMCPN